MKLGIQVFVLALVLGCQKNKNTIQDDSAVKQLVSETSVGKRSVIDHIPGSAYAKKANEYFVVQDNDTSSFKPIFSEYKSDGFLNLSMNLSYKKDSVSHSQKMKELEWILKNAEQDYSLDSLKSISIGRLILLGDLAIDVTNEYVEKYGYEYRISTSDYSEVSRFLLESKLTTTFDRLLTPYSLEIEEVGIEKVFFAEGKLYTDINLVTDSLKIPERILDCITWLEVKKK